MTEENELHTSKKYFSKNGQYEKKRAELHDDIIKRCLEPHEQALDKPLAIFLGGGSGSGKTTISKMLVQSFKDAHEQVLHIDSDKIKTMLPEYEKLLEIDPQNAARIVHDESSDIALRLYDEALKKKVNFILDGTMKNLELYKRLIEAAKENDYATSIVIADVPVEEALRRAERRYEIEKRRVPEDIIRFSHKAVPNTFKHLENDVDSFYLYDTSKRHPEQFYVRENENVLVHNAERLMQFYQKGNDSLQPSLEDVKTNDLQHQSTRFNQYKDFDYEQ